MSIIRFSWRTWPQQSFAGQTPPPTKHTRARTHSQVSLPSLISTETHTKQPVTYPLQPREMLVNINVSIHAGHPCQQLDSLVEKKPFFWPETKFSPLPCPRPLPLRNVKLCSNFPTSLARVLQPFPKQFQRQGGSDQTVRLLYPPPPPPDTHRHQLRDAEPAEPGDLAKGGGGGRQTWTRVVNTHTHTGEHSFR